MPTNAAAQQFIQAQLAAGKSIEEIKTALTAQGWDTAVINDSLAAAQSGTPLPSTAILNQDGEGTSGGMTALTIVLLWLLAPVGIIVMWTSTQWSKSVKWTLTILFGILPVLAILGILAVGVLSAVNPRAQIHKGEITKARSDVEQIINASERYFADNGTYPSSIRELVDANQLKPSFINPDRTDYEYTLRQTNAGKDCEITVKMPDEDPFVVICSTVDFSKFDEMMVD